MTVYKNDDDLLDRFSELKAMRNQPHFKGMVVLFERNLMRGIRHRFDNGGELARECELDVLNEIDKIRSNKF